MSAFFIATVTVKNPEKMQAYAKAAADTFAPFGGEITLRGKAVATLAGDLDHENIGLVRFPDMDSLNRWFSSPAYQAIIPLRKEAADMTIVAYAAS